MKNLETIKTIKNAVLCWAAKANEMIERLNLPWQVKNPTEDDGWGNPEFQYSKTKITFDLSQINTVELKACDEDGNEATYILIGIKKPEPSDD